MHDELQRYLNDHLAGSAVAVDLIQSLAEVHDDPEESQFFMDLKFKIEHDRNVLKNLLERLGFSDSGILQAAGNLTAKATKLKLWWEGFKPGELGNFEALEMLVLGIQGKRFLWAVLREIAPQMHEWEGIQFEELEQEALSQRNSVEIRRIQAGKEALLESDRRFTVRL